MGALHRGHASLVERCRRENEIVVVSIFVNPIAVQRSEGSGAISANAGYRSRAAAEPGVDEVIVPGASEMYPHGYRFRVEAKASDEVMEGAHRPGFLTGVMTVVLKLLNIVRADRAYFGEKDYQQLRAITEMAQEFFIPTEIVPCATVREESGLAESSRNMLLSPDAGKPRRRSCFER